MAGFFVPNGRFSFTRAYPVQIVVEDQSPNITMLGARITTLIDPMTGYRIEYNLNTAFLAWSSNHYTLDHVVDSCFWFGSYADAPHLQDYVVQWWTEPSNIKQSIRIYNHFIITDKVILDLPTTSSPYWAYGTDN